MPELFIITGSNGAGKSSIGPSYLPNHLKDSIFDGDKLFMHKRKQLWQSGVKSHKECKKIALEFVENTFDDLVANAQKNNSDFAYEGHFTNDATWDIPKQFLKNHYTLHLLFFGVTDTKLSQTRVIGRANEGGHYVEPATVSANYFGNLEKLDKYYELFDSVNIVDTSSVQHKPLAVLKKGKPTTAVPVEQLPFWFKSNLRNITKTIELSGIN